MNRLGLKISCLLVSIVIWIQVAATSVVEQGTAMPLRVVGLGEGFTVAGSPLPPSVRVRVRGSKLSLMTHNYFNRYIGEVRLNLVDRTPGPAFSYELARADVFTDLEVTSIQRPDRFRLRLDFEERRRLAVNVATAGSLPADVGFLAPVTAVPDSVTVVGPRRFFPESTAVSTEPIDLGRLDQSRDLDVALVAPHDQLRLEVGQVEARFRLAKLEDRTLANIPVVPLVDAGRPEVGVSPPVADVMVRGVADSVRTLTKSRFSVTVAVGNLAEGIYLLPGQVDHPSWLTLIGMAPAEFQVIVGNPPLLPGAGAGPPAGGAGD